MSQKLECVSEADSLDALRDTTCTPEKPVCVLARHWGGALEAAGQIFSRHSEGFRTRDAVPHHFKPGDLQKFHQLIPDLCAAFKDVADDDLYVRAQSEIQIIIDDVAALQRMGCRSTVIFVPDSGYKDPLVYNFHQDTIKRDRVMCNYLSDTTQGLQAGDVASTWNHTVIDGSIIRIFNATDGTTPYSFKPGDITKHAKDWIHRAPPSNRLRLLLMGTVA